MNSNLSVAEVISKCICKIIKRSMLEWDGGLGIPAEIQRISDPLMKVVTESKA